MSGQCAESVVGGRGEGGASANKSAKGRHPKKFSATGLCANTRHGTLILARPANLAWMTSAAAEKD